jgi:hypothetical protein
MKKVFTFVVGVLLLNVAAVRLGAQSFSVAYDTVNWTPPSGLNFTEDSIAPTSSSVTLQWKVINPTNLPADWIPLVGICDNITCYPMTGLWPSGTVKTSNPYPMTGVHDFHLQADLDAATTLGCYLVKVRMNNAAILGDTAIENYIVCKTSPTASPVVIRSSNDVVLYPNPATNEVNVVYDAGADVKNIAIYSIIGKMSAIYKVNGNSANLNLENIPAGIYFVRLVNSQGNVVATKKFSKQ